MRSAIKTGVVAKFRGDHFFLSNFDVHEPFTWRNVEFVSGEQAFSYAKTLYADNQAEANAMRTKILATADPGEAKGFGSNRRMLLDVTLWDGGHRVQIMREIVHAKFSGVTGYAGKLVNTGAQMLVEGNNWGDKFWGRSLDKTTGKMVGYNTLGVILMEERGLWLRG